MVASLRSATHSGTGIASNRNIATNGAAQDDRNEDEVLAYFAIRAHYEWEPKLTISTTHNAPRNGEPLKA